MPWKSITEADVQTALSGPEMSALQTEFLDHGQVEVIRQTVDQTIGLVRGYVAANEANDLDADDLTVPAALVPATLSIARWRLLGRLPGSDLLSELRRTDYEDAIKHLEAVAAGRISIDTSTSDRSGNRSPVSWGSCTQLTGLG